MNTYAIGDLQGCFAPFQRLLKKINFHSETDKLWLTGDLVNRGPDSLQTLKYVKSLAEQYHATIVLGNHDFTLLAVGYNVIPYQPKHHTFQDILAAPDKAELLDWLRHQPLLHHDAKLGYTLVHAGLHPHWDLPLAIELAREIEALLQGPNFLEFLEYLYGNEPDQWDPALSGWDRARFIVNCFTRLRFCSPDGKLELTTKAGEHTDANYLPWFAIPNRLTMTQKIIFGHWAALNLRQSQAPYNVVALDSGCVWGNALTAFRLQDGRKWLESCHDIGPIHPSK